MIHIKTPVDVFPHWAQTDIVDADGTVLVSCASGHEGEMIAGEIKRALDERDDLVAQRAALVAACKSILVFLTGDEHHEYYYQAQVRQLRAALALVKGDEATE